MLKKENIYANMLKLVEVPGVSGTEQEVLTAHKLQELLYEIPYFAEHKDQVRLVPVENDPFDRCIVTAFMALAPERPDTVILTGHYDVVDVEEFGHLQEYAYDVEKITKLIDQMPLDEDSRKDFQSGEWLFGRGTADMKYGHALCLELMRHYDEEGGDGLNGNLLYAAVCGEETNSEGMLTAIPFFNRFAEEKKLNYTALLLTECCMMEDQANDTNHYIHYGASGKIMPMYFFVGEATHAGEPFLGIDPNLLAAEVYRMLHLNSEFCQQSHGETTPPPVCLKMQDLKTAYSVSTPLYTAAYYNMVTVNLNPEQVMKQLLTIGKRAFENALALMDSRADEFERIAGEKPVTYPISPCVMTFRQLYRQTAETYEGNLEQEMKAYAKELTNQKLELQDISVKLVKRVYELYKDKRPMIIVSIIPPYYPDVYIDPAEPDAAKLLQCVNEIIDYADETYSEPLKLKNYYMGISDMCYTGLSKGMDFDKIFENLIGVDSFYRFPLEDMKQFRVPGIVLGGYGKDFHKHTERLHINYNFNVLPDLYNKLIHKLLQKGSAPHHF